MEIEPISKSLSPSDGLWARRGIIGESGRWVKFFDKLEGLLPRGNFSVRLRLSQLLQHLTDTRSGWQIQGSHDVVSRYQGRRVYHRFARVIIAVQQPADDRL